MTNDCRVRIPGRSQWTGGRRLAMRLCARKRAPFRLVTISGERLATNQQSDFGAHRRTSSRPGHMCESPRSDELSVAIVGLLRGGAVVAHRAHNPGAAGSIPAPATTSKKGKPRVMSGSASLQRPVKRRVNESTPEATCPSGARTPALARGGLTAPRTSGVMPSGLRPCSETARNRKHGSTCEDVTAGETATFKEAA